MFKARWLGATVLGAALAVATVSAGRAADADHKDEWSKINILFIPWSQSSNAFFEAVVNGAKDAAVQQRVNIDIQFGEEDANKQKTIFETGIANKVSGIAINIADDDAYVETACNAMKQGIPIVTFNIDDSRHGAPDAANVTPLFEARNIYKSYGSFIALQTMNVHIGSREVVGLLGDNGAGKSTLIKLISGINLPTSGEIYVN